MTFNDATTIEEATTALASARKKLKNNDGWNIGIAAAKHVATVLEPDVAVIGQIIARFTADTSAECADDALRPVLLGKLVGADSFDSVINWAHGWVKRRVDSFVDVGEPARVPQEELHEALLTFVRSHDRIDILRSFAGTPTHEQVVEEIAVRTYVNQLRIINIDGVEVLQAVNDYLRASVDRTAWSDQGLITEQSLKTLENELTTTWRNKRRRTRIAFGSKDEKDQRQVLYSDCMEHDACLDGLGTPRQFVRGSWHALADEQSIGWHPYYNRELAGFGSASSENGTEGK